MSENTQGWHAMDTAPHDRRILVKSESGGIYAAHWVCDPFSGDEAYCVSEGPDGTQHLVHPVEWREIEQDNDQSAEIERLQADLAQCQQDRQHEHDLRVKISGESEDLREQVRALSEALAPFAALLPGSLGSVGGGTLVTPTIKVQMVKEARAALAAVREPTGSPYREDAERWRYARKGLQWADCGGGEVRWVLFIHMPTPKTCADELSEDSVASSLDAAIDAARGKA